MLQCRIRRHKILLAAVIFAPRHLWCIGGEIAPADTMVRADLGAAQAREKAFRLVRARVAGFLLLRSPPLAFSAFLKISPAFLAARILIS
jgi:hypothetical protein